MNPPPILPELRRLPDQFPVIVSYLDRDFRYVYSNPVHAQVYRRPREEIEGRLASEIQSSDFATAVAPFLQQVIAGHTHEFQYGNLRVRLIPDLAESGEVRGIFVAGSDLSELENARRKAESLHRITARLSRARDLVELRHEIGEQVLSVFGADLGTLSEYAGGESVALTATWNDGGTLRPKWDQYPLSTHLPVPEAIRTKEPIYLSSEQEMIDRYQVDPRQWRGSPKAWAALPLIAQDRVIGAIGLAWNHERTFGVSVRHFMQTLAGYVAEAMERASLFGRVQETQEQLQLAVDASELGIWDWVVTQNQLTWSPRQEKIFGLPPGGFQNTFEHYQSLLHPEDRYKHNRVVLAAIDEKRPYTTVHRVVWPDGTTHWIQGRGKPYFDAQGQLVRMTGTCMSIDEKIESQIQLQKAVIARDEFISVASHELKTPVTSLKLQVQFFKRRMQQGDDPKSLLKEMVRVIEQSDRSVNRLTQLIDDLLDVSRIDSGRFAVRSEPTDLAALLRDVAERFRPQFTDAAMCLELTANEPMLTHADPFRLEQVLTNLFSNAVRYAAGTRVQASVTRNEGEIQVAIRDHGPGIPKEEHERIFGRFERGVRASSSSGLGLGLFICRNIVEAHGGRLEIESEPGQGAVFQVILPATLTDYTKTV